MSQKPVIQPTESQRPWQKSLNLWSNSSSALQLLSIDLDKDLENLSEGRVSNLRLQPVRRRQHCPQTVTFSRLAKLYTDWPLLRLFISCHCRFSHAYLPAKQVFFDFSAEKQLSTFQRENRKQHGNYDFLCLTRFLYKS